MRSLNNGGEISLKGDTMLSITGEIVDIKELLRWNLVCFVEKQARITIGGKFSRTVILPAVEGPSGANVLPYFVSEGKCYIVLVAQFRNAVEIVTWEAPGGIIGPEGVLKSMARELEEEVGVKVNLEDIQVVFKEYLLPSLINAFGWGGVVEINKNDLPPDRIYGEPQENEFTLLVVRPLVEIIEMRKSGEIVFDLWTSRLINEVANKLRISV
ncbi:MAG: NUDIX domain-containing protein [Candidatus Yanofskybacteria bacterium]|nr:NUDIX domain-containing protein [Candidatus Yanofskybacteria bacterium]